MYNDILLAVDLADDTSWSKSVPAAVDLSRCYDAKLHVMCVVPDFGMTLVASFFPEDYEKNALAEAKKRLHEWSKDNLPVDLPVQHVVGHGKPYDEIIRVANEIDCDLIVIGALRADNAGYELGPTAARVLRHAKQSVLVVRN